MDSETPTLNGPAPADADGSPEDAALAPYRNWALQHNVISMLGGDTAWRLHPEIAAAGEEQAGEMIRGNGALLEQLEPDPDYRSRIRAMAALWVTALILEAVNHFTAIGIMASDANYYAISGLALFALAVTVLVFPRVSFRRFILLGQLTLIFAYALIAVKCAGTGGASSPYAVFWVFVSVYVAYFVDRPRATPNHRAHDGGDARAAGLRRVGDDRGPRVSGGARGGLPGARLHGRERPRPHAPRRARGQVSGDGRSVDRRREPALVRDRRRRADAVGRAAVRAGAGRRQRSEGRQRGLRLRDRRRPVAPAGGTAVPGLRRTRPGRARSRRRVRRAAAGRRRSRSRSLARALRAAGVAPQRMGA